MRTVVNYSFFIRCVRNTTFEFTGFCVHITLMKLVHNYVATHTLCYSYTIIWSQPGIDTIVGSEQGIDTLIENLSRNKTLCKFI